jgi:nucleoid-associated protein YgaU
MIRKGSVSVLLAVLICGLASSAFAAEEKMTREEYTAKLAEYNQGEQQANSEITDLDSQIAALQAQLNDLDGEIAALDKAILMSVGASSNAAVVNFGRQLDGILGQLEALTALAPEELYMHHRMELEDIAAQLHELQQSKIAALPEMAAKLSRIQEMLGQLQSRGLHDLAQFDYTVERGDHLWGIAEKETIYSDPYMWPRIYKANSDKVADPDLIYPDQVLAIPVTVGANQYLVQSGDFLFKIAQAVYNDPTKWHKILSANESQIVEKDMIFPAQVLDIPAN